MFDKSLDNWQRGQVCEAIPKVQLSSLVISGWRRQCVTHVCGFVQRVHRERKKWEDEPYNKSRSSVNLMDPSSTSHPRRKKIIRTEKAGNYLEWPFCFWWRVLYLRLSQPLVNPLLISVRILSCTRLPLQVFHKCIEKQPSSNKCFVCSWWKGNAKLTFVS